MIYRILTEVDALLGSRIVSMPERILSTVQAYVAVDTTRQDPLIARKLEVWQYAGIIVLALGLVVLVRVLSPRVEHAILFAIFLSVILIVFFVTG